MAATPVATTFFHDISEFQGDYHPAGPIIAKATQGDWWTDPDFTQNRARTIAGGWPFLGYHFIEHTPVAAQAAHCVAVMGKDQPVMVDQEEVVVNGVRRPDPTLADVFGFADAYRAAGGGPVTLLYLPHWYWQGNLKSPSLAGVWARGIGLVSSNYTTYSDTGPGWAPYAPGELPPVIWQYSSTPLDSNAFKGTTQALRDLFEGGHVTQPAQSYNEIHNVSLGIFTGGSSCGRAVPTNPTSPWAGKASNALMAKLDDLLARMDHMQADLDLLKSEAPSSSVAAHTHDGGTTGGVTPTPTV